jgi:hypothetical protein
MFKKLFSIICALVIVGCEKDNSSDDPNYTFSDQITVASISDPTGNGGLAEITDVNDNYIIVVTDSVQLQRLKTDGSGFYDISRDQYTIIAPGDGIQFAYTKDQIDYSPRPPVVYADTIRIMK